MEEHAEAINHLSPSETAYVLLLDRSDDAGIIWLKDLAAPLADVDRRIIHLGHSSTDLSAPGLRDRVAGTQWSVPGPSLRSAA